jgi:predicted DCC family thiol-disulfide oxidoreductase YuxK
MSDAELSTTEAPDAAASASDGSPVLFFDGVCGLCNRFVDFILRHDHRRALRLAPLQGETAEALLGRDDRESVETVVLRAGERSFRRSAAVVRVLWRLGAFWKVVGGLLWLVPLPLRDLGYRIVAGNRYRLFGRKETCRIPTPEERGRLLP